MNKYREQFEKETGKQCICDANPYCEYYIDEYVDYLEHLLKCQLSYNQDIEQKLDQFGKEKNMYMSALTIAIRVLNWYKMGDVYCNYSQNVRDTEAVDIIPVLDDAGEKSRKALLKIDEILKE